MAVLGKIEKVYDIPKPVRVADEIEFDDEQTVPVSSEVSEDTTEQESTQPVPAPA